MKCFADDGVICTVFNKDEKKNCEGCAFFKTSEQKAKDDEKTRLRLESTKNIAINIFN